jgi:inorganic pyrophosphatase
MANEESFDVLVEIPKGCRNKYEVDQHTGRITLDRTLFTSMGYPDCYGYIEGTLGEDGDPLDALVMLPIPVFPGCVVKCRPIAMFHMADEEGPDDKILCVPTDVRYDGYQDLKDVNEFHLKEIQNFFENYKVLEPGKAVKPGTCWKDKATALKMIKAAFDRVNDPNAKRN